MNVSLKVVLSSIAGAVLLFNATSDAAFKPRPRTLVSRKSQDRCALAFDPSNNLHVTYIGGDYHLYHAWLSGRTWRREVVDAISDCGWGNSIAIDSQGHIHISYHAERFEPSYHQPLVYAHYGGMHWEITELPVNGWDTHIKLDADGHPHILFHGSTYELKYAQFDGANWQIEDTGFSGGPSSVGLALDADGHAHISYAINYQGTFYATNKSGQWESTMLVPNESQSSAIAIDSQGQPRVVTGSGNSLRYHTYDGNQWTSEDLYDIGDLPPGVQVLIEDVTLALDAAGRAHFLGSAYISAGEGGIEIAYYAFHNGTGWNGVLVDVKNAGFRPSLILDAQGSAYGTYSTGERRGHSKAKWVRIALPDLTGTWTNLVVAQTTVTGTLVVQNRGQEKSVATTVRLWLSDDTVPDASDQLLPVTPKIRTLKPGVTANIAVKVQPTGSLAGKYLIAVLDADAKTFDHNLQDNIVPVFLGP